MNKVHSNTFYNISELVHIGRRRCNRGCTLFPFIFFRNFLRDSEFFFHFLGMFSWFPIFFPLRNPVKLHQGDEVELHFWRLNNSKQVWYEWCITKPVAVPIHNPNGRSYTIGL